METNDRRKRGSLKLAVQRVIAFRLTLHWLAAATVAIVLTVILQYFANPTLGAEERAAQRALTWGPMALAFLATAPIAALDMARFSHSIAGPVIRVRRVISDMADGKSAEHVQFRKGDYWKELADEVNRLSAELKRLRALETQTAPKGEPEEALASI